tara:strand:- start:5738 stop:6040 length:303 start_codon:yes stop_codon:yes gene_type:complete
MLSVIKLFILLLICDTNVLETNGLCVECRRCRFFFNDYKCKMFAKDEKYGESVVYNYNLSPENDSFKYLTILQARQEDHLCGKKGYFFTPILYKTNLKES